MTKQSDVFKGRVKRLLREQKDMGQVGEPAVQCCVTAIEAFVRDLGRKLKAQAELHGASGAITPVELKHVVMATPAFDFLQERVASIDESDAKYHKSHAAKKKTTPAKKRTAAETAAAKSDAKAKKAAAPSKAKKAKTASVAATTAANSVPVLPASVKKTQEIEIAEDDDYDESDSE
ncbi:hypothetical protein Gpo141_00007247 [Globisporangium polare]